MHFPFLKVSTESEGQHHDANKTHGQLQINRANAVDLSVMRDVREEMMDIVGVLVSPFALMASFVLFSALSHPRIAQCRWVAWCRRLAGTLAVLWMAALVFAMAVKLRDASVRARELEAEKGRSANLALENDR